MTLSKSKVSHRKLLIYKGFFTFCDTFSYFLIKRSIIKEVNKITVTMITTITTIIASVGYFWGFC